MQNEIIKLTQDLIKQQSISPNDADCQKIITDFLLPLGFKIENMNFNQTSNLWATHGSGAPVIAFAGHTDVVPVGDINQWQHDPFGAEIVNNNLYGRGAVDMKGGLAAMLVAAKTYIQENPQHKGTIAFLITSDEESVAIDGTARVVEELMLREQPIDYCIVGEPSSAQKIGDVLKVGRRGSITADLYVKGVQGHIAYPELTDNPIHNSLAMLSDLVAIQWDNGNEYFPPTSLQIANIKAGTGANNIVPGELYVQFNLRYSTEVNDEFIKQVVADLLKKHKLNYQIEWWLSGKPFLTKKGKLIDAIADAIVAETNITPELNTKGGTSDGRFIALMGTEVVEFGPLNHTMHKVDECVNCDDLYTIGKVYKQTLTKLLA